MKRTPGLILAAFVATCGGPGPFGFNPREMEQSLVLLMEQEKCDLKSK